MRSPDVEAIGDDRVPIVGCGAGGTLAEVRYRNASAIGGPVVGDEREVHSFALITSRPL